MDLVGHREIGWWLWFCLGSASYHLLQHCGDSWILDLKLGEGL